MIFIWQGYGFLGLLVPFLMSLITQMTSDSLYEKGFYTSHPIIPAIVLLISSALIWFLGVKLNSEPGKLLIDPKTGQQFEFKKKHTIFWIPMQWFSAVIAAIALSSFFK
jgi:hypothetical protein